MNDSQKLLTEKLEEVVAALEEKAAILRRTSDEYVDLKRQESDLRATLKKLNTKMVTA